MTLNSGTQLGRWGEDGGGGGWGADLVKNVLTVSIFELNFPLKM